MKIWEELQASLRELIQCFVKRGNRLSGSWAVSNVREEQITRSLSTLRQLPSFSHQRQMDDVWAAVGDCPRSSQTWGALCPPPARGSPWGIGSKHAWQPVSCSRSKASQLTKLSKRSVLKCSWVYLLLGPSWYNYKPVILASDFAFGSLLDPWPALFFFSAACRLRSGVSPPPFFLLQSRTEWY